MQHIHSLQEINLSKSYLSIGTYDGIHRGHQTLIRQLVKHAHEKNTPAVVITFFPHPIVVLRDLKDPFFITSPDERAELLGKLDVDYVITLKFDKNLAKLSAFEFMENISHNIGLEELWIGADFSLGRGREGTTEKLSAIGKELGYTVQIISNITNGEDKISSSRIRQYLVGGRMADVARLLGRWYSLESDVVHGDGRGHTIGIPTANLNFVPKRIIPKAGVYACWAHIDNERIPAVTNVGVRPTFETKLLPPRIEAHLIDYRKDLYGKHLKIEFTKFIRPEMKFPSVSSLLSQIQSDIQTTLEVLPNASKTQGLSS